MLSPTNKRSKGKRMGKNLLKRQKQAIIYGWRRILRSFGQAKRTLVRKSRIQYKRSVKNIIAAYTVSNKAFLHYIDVFIIKENKVSIKVADFVERFDVTHERVAKKTGHAATEGNRRFRFVRIMIDRRRSQLLKHFAIIVMVAVAVLSLFNYATGYEYSYHGKVLGVVKDQEDVFSVLDVVSKQLSEVHDVNISIGQTSDIQFRKVVTVNRDIDNMEEVLNRLTYMKDINVTGYGIFVDGKRAAVLSSQGEADGVLAGLLEKFSKTKNGIRYEQVSFKEKVKVREVSAKLGNLESGASVARTLLSEEVSDKIHVVAAGETKATIAQQFGLTVAKLEAANPTIKGRKIAVGEKLTIKETASVLHIATVEKATYNVPIAHATELRNNPNAYKGINTTKTKGKNGTTQVVARVIRVNGTETGRQILKQTVTTKPVTEVILVGSKPIPPTMGDGHFINPCPSGRLTSTFGYRWGRMHWGIDLACPVGSSVRAADGGTVVFTGWGGARGYYIDIDHQNGFMTRYQHLSKMLVHTGQKVYEGQLIARSGNTGSSTGAHLHFEILRNGVNVNPLNYI
jgi:murein DD-endopeptidase MepM/ murein hydrolase activator NlpD